LATTLVTTTAFAADNNSKLPKGAKKATQAGIFKGQSYFLPGVDKFYVEFRFQQDKLKSIYFWNHGDIPVIVDLLQQEFVVPAKDGEHQIFTIGAKEMLVTVKPYEPTMSARLKQVFPGKEYYFIKSDKNIGYDMYTVDADPASKKEAQVLDEKLQKEQQQ